MDVNPKIEAARVGTGAILTGAYALTMQEIIGFLTIAYFIVQLIILFPKLHDTLGRGLKAVKGWFK